MFRLRVSISHISSYKATLSCHEHRSWRIGSTLPRKADMEVIKRLEVGGWVVALAQHKLLKDLLKLLTCVEATRIGCIVGTHKTFTSISCS